MVLKITPGTLPADGARIRVQDTMNTFVGTPKIENFGADAFSGGTVNFVLSQTDAPATDSRARGTLWFQRGLGALWSWQPVLLPTGVTTGSAPTDFRWVQLGGKKRTNVVFVQRPCLQGELLGPLSEISGGVNATPMGTATDGKFKGIRSIEDQFTLVMSSTSPEEGHLGRNFVLDPILVAEDDIASASDYVTMADWGFVDALCFGSGKYAMLYGGGPPSGASEASTQLYAQCTSYSAAGDVAAIMGFRTGSTATDGLRLTEIFKRPSITNLVHG